MPLHASALPAGLGIVRWQPWQSAQFAERCLGIHTLLPEYSPVSQTYPERPIL